MSREVYGILIGLSTFLITLLPPELFVLAVALLGTLMARELCLALNIGSLFYPSAFVSVLFFYIHPSVGGVITVLFALMYAYKKWELESFFRSFFVLFYVGFFTSYIARVREEGLIGILALLFMVWANDIFAYYVGRRMGRTPLFPKLSPKKTLEGFLGGIFAGLLVFLLLSGKGLMESLLIGFITLLTGVFGDYLKSFIKRQLGIKDFASTLGGHGGFVDRFDALVMSAPVFYWLMFRI